MFQERIKGGLVFLGYFIIYLGGDSWELGWCLDSSGNDQNSGTVSLGPKSSTDQCLYDCKKTAGATGCEYSRNHCSVHTQDVASGNGQSSHHCYVLQEKGLYFVYLGLAPWEGRTLLL